ncbi:hypothetical protein [Shewanella surugensis]|uniref:DUF4440 domain-containing protein n=1 Tax=Shewanella surugensis TaxID=212020 RepID=A0ABT0LGT9_9GAMM|nr:hypothetical protein [Shewanella surugensis]MCL1126908.1 hypothetical protein [Shewanella surugensis]
MDTDTLAQSIADIQLFAEQWNTLYAAQRFDEMKLLATTDVGIANAEASISPSGLIFGRDNYKKGITDTYYGESGEEHNLLVMQYLGWEYIPLSEDTFYTIGRYTLEPNIIGVNAWLLRRETVLATWKIFRVINN